MNEQMRIMCAVDLSRRSEGAFEYAVALAKSRRVQLELLFAVSPRNPFIWRARERVAQLVKLRQRASAAQVDMTVTVQHGKPADVILQRATSSHTGSPQLIVLGAPSRRGIARISSPSVAQAVVHDIDRPTLVVPGSEVAGSSVPVPFRRILCAIDFSSASMSALDEAVRLLKEGHGTMTLLHVVDVVHPAVPRIALEFPAFDHTTLLTEYAGRRLHSLLPVSEELDGRVHTQVAVGLTVDEIVRNAKDLKADLVVLGVRKRGGLARLLGSTTGHALRRTECPVLAVPADNNEWRADADLHAIAA